MWWPEHVLGIGEVRRASKQNCYVDFLRTDFGLLRSLVHRVHRVSRETALEDKDKPAGKKTRPTEQKALTGIQWKKGEFMTFGRRVRSLRRITVMS